MPFGGGGERSKSDGDGRYAFDDIKEGTYTLKVEHPTRRMAQEYELDVVAGENSFDVDLSLSVIEGRITDLDGQPIPGLEVSAERAVQEEGGGQFFAIRMEMSNDDAVISTSGDLGGESTTTDEDGRYRLRGVTPDVELVVKATGDRIQCYLDGTKLLDHRDKTFTKTGYVGVWTKADAVSLFSEFTAVTKSK